MTGAGFAVRTSPASPTRAARAALGYEVAGGEAHDGTGWASWRNRTHRVYQTLFPPRE